MTSLNEERPHLLHKTKTDDKNKKPLSYTPFVQLVFFPPNFFLPSANKQTFALYIYCPNPLLFHPSIVLPFYCSKLLLFYISIVLFFYCSVPLIVLSLYCSMLLLSYSSIVLPFCHFTRLHLPTITSLYCPNTLLSHSSIVKQLGRLS